MITRYALFEGTVKEGQTEAFRAAILESVLPKWKAFPGALDVRVCFADERDDGAPEFPLILAINYRDMDAVRGALASPARADARAATEAVLSRFFEGRIHHHVTQGHEFSLMLQAGSTGSAMPPTTTAREVSSRSSPEV